MNKLRASLILLTMTLLSGCFSTSSLVPEKKDSSFYLVDTKAGTLCEGNTGFCVQFSLAASQNGALPDIEEAYQQRITGPNYPRSLMIILLKPADSSYAATSIDSTGRLYNLPKNTKTNIAWKVLNDLYQATYQ